MANVDVANSTTNFYMGMYDDTAVPPEGYIVPSAPDDILKQYDQINSVWAWMPLGLKLKTNLYTEQKIREVKTVNGQPINVDTLYPVIISLHLARRAAIENPTDIRAWRQDPSVLSVQKTNAEFLEIADNISVLLSNHFQAEYEVYTLIDNLTVTDPAGIETAWWNAFNTLQANPELPEVIASNQELLARLEELETLEGGLEAWANGMNTAVAGKANASHTHTVSDITGFNAAVDARIAGIIDSAPGNLDTLNELAEALGDDPNFATTVTTALTGKVDKVTGKGLSTNDFTTTLKDKLDGLSNSKAIIGTTTYSGAFAVAKSGTVSGGNLVLHYTVDGLSTGAALFPNGILLDSLQLRADNEVDSPHMFGTPVLSNGNKTVTIPVKKSTGLNVAVLSLTLLGAPVAANGSVIKALVFGY